MKDLVNCEKTRASLKLNAQITTKLEKIVIGPVLMQLFIGHNGQPLNTTSKTAWYSSLIILL